MVHHGTLNTHLLNDEAIDFTAGFSISAHEWGFEYILQVHLNAALLPTLTPPPATITFGINLSQPILQPAGELAVVNPVTHNPVPQTLIINRTLRSCHTQHIFPKLKSSMHALPERRGKTNRQYLRGMCAIRKDSHQFSQ